MKPHLKKYHAEFWSSDIKPAGKMSRYINKSERQRAKREIREEVKDSNLVACDCYLPECEERHLVDEIMLAQDLP